MSLENQEPSIKPEILGEPGAGRTNTCEIQKARPPCSTNRVLTLTLKRGWFDMIASGEKREEYRMPSKWILSRLEGKQYDAVRFRNGYRPDSPVCVCEYNGWRYGYGKRKWGGGSMPGHPLVVIQLGRVLTVLPL